MLKLQERLTCIQSDLADVRSAHDTVHVYYRGAIERVVERYDDLRRLMRIRYAICSCIGSPVGIVLDSQSSVADLVGSMVLRALRNM